MAKGTAQKRFSVVPRRFTGEPLRLAADLSVAGFASMHVELYLARGSERPAIQVSCAGTLVADDIGELHALDLDDAPWVGCELSGLIDFPGVTVPPGSRRGVVPDRAAEAFARAMLELQPLVRTSCGDWSASAGPPQTGRSSRSCAARCAVCAGGCRSTTCLRFWEPVAVTVRTDAVHPSRSSSRKKKHRSRSPSCSPPATWRR